MSEHHEDRIKSSCRLLPWQPEVYSEHDTGDDVYDDGENTKTHRISLNSWILVLHLF